MAWDPHRERDLSEEVLNILACVFSGGLYDREIEIAEAEARGDDR